MMKKTKRYQDGGYLLDSEGNRVKSGSGDDIRSGSYDKEADMESARNKLAQDVQKKLKDDSDSARVSKDAEEGARAPTSSVKASDGMDESDRRREAAESAPKRQDSVKTKPSVTKPRPYKQDSEQQKERFLKEIGVSKPAVSSSYRPEGANKAKPAASSGSAATAKKPKYETPLDRYGRKKAEDEAKTKSERQEYSKKLASDPAQIAIKKERETKDTRSASERSADRGRSIKEFFGINTKKPLDPKGAVIQSMDTDVMRTGSRTAAKEAGEKGRNAAAAREATAKDKKTFGAMNRTETNRSQRESAMRDDKSSYKKGGSINGIAKRGLTRCKTV
jgi:hypothetical protein